MSYKPLVKQINLKEHDNTQVLKEDLPFLEKESLQEISEKFLPLVTITTDLSGQYINFKAGAKIGVIQSRSMRVQVRPR